MYSNDLFNKIHKFMYGRYGKDQLYSFQFKFLIVLLIIDLFFNSLVLSVLEFLTLVIMCFRFFSKNIYKRCRENELFLDIKYNISKPFVNIKRNITDKKHIYKRCSCGTTVKVKVPKTRGIKHAKCPNCGKRVRLFTLKKCN